uniref:Regulator of chromosome condensation protein n=1 Tax=Pithovirus LCPAC302 TaxID=2506593 RepID=A0A481Z7D2_9VIRU|nr:MAG: regulator of chromosome condensation protein [Pithovirus LCPAC302]
MIKFAITNSFGFGEFIKGLEILRYQILYRNGSGQLGTGDKQGKSVPTNVMNNIKYVSCGGDHTGVITTDNKLFMFGLNDEGQLGTGDKNDRSTPTNVMTDIKYISCGNFHTGVIGK